LQSSESKAAFMCANMSRRYVQFETGSGVSAPTRWLLRRKISHPQFISGSS
jgi:hypothetical protein